MKTVGIKLTVTNTVLAIGLGMDEEIELFWGFFSIVAMW